MRQSILTTIRTVLKTLLSIVLSPFSLLILGIGIGSLVCSVRIHTSAIYYVEYPYVFVGIVWTILGSASMAATLLGIWGPGLYRPLPMLSIVFFLLATQKIPDWLPRSYALEADIHHLEFARHSLRTWYEKHGQFPQNQAEFESAVSDAPSSLYAQQGRPVPYEAEVTADATGPRAVNPSPRPGVTYYCVSPNRQEYWLTMTELDADLGSNARFFRAIQQNGEWFLHATGSDFQNKKH